MTKLYRLNKASKYCDAMNRQLLFKVFAFSRYAEVCLFHLSTASLIMWHHSGFQAIAALKTGNKMHRLKDNENWQGKKCVIDLPLQH